MYAARGTPLCSLHLPWLLGTAMSLPQDSLTEQGVL